MCKISGKVLMLAVLAFLLNTGVALADPASTDWNNSWGFPTSFEKANLLNQALAINLVEGGGAKNETNFYNSSAVAIANQVIIKGDDNAVNQDFNGNQAAQSKGEDLGQKSEIDNNNSNNVGSEPMGPSYDQ